MLLFISPQNHISSTFFNLSYLPVTVSSFQQPLKHQFHLLFSREDIQSYFWQVCWYSQY